MVLATVVPGLVGLSAKHESPRSLAALRYSISLGSSDNLHKVLSDQFDQWVSLRTTGDDRKNKTTIS